MQWANQIVSGQVVPVAAATPSSTGVLTGGRAEFSDYKVIRRNGSVVGFEPAKINIAMTKAFLAVNGGQGAASARVREQVEALTQSVVSALMRRMPSGGTLHIEDIQDQVELSLMRGGEHEVARSYVLYRESRAQERAKSRKDAIPAAAALHVVENGVRVPFDPARIQGLIEAACEGLTEFVSAEIIFAETVKNLYDGVPIDEVHKSAILAARSQLEKDPAYSKVTARLLLHTVRTEVLQDEVSQAAMAPRYAEYFPRFIKRGIDIELLDERLAQYDLERMGAALDSRRDLQFDYLGLQTLYDRYFLIDRNDTFSRDGRRIELPQAFFMRVAMGLALNEIDREARAIEFYEILSRFDFMSSTPTLFNAGTRHSQLSSCYLTTVSDDLDGIYEAIKENALLAKYAGGLGNDWTPVRALGSHIKGTNGESQGVVPFLKVVNDTAVAVNQCFAPDTRIFTSTGARPIRDLQRGDLVLTQHGDYREITQHLTYNQVDPMVEIKVKHSLRPLRVTAGHPMFALRNVPLEQSVARTRDWLKKGKVEAQWTDAGQLAVGDYVAMVVPSEVVPISGFGEEDARLYGILLGDGEHHAKTGEWTVSGNPSRHAHIAFVRDYLVARGVQFSEQRRDERHCQLRWSETVQALREGSSNLVVGGNSLPLRREDMYDAGGHKHIAPRFAHLPRSQTLALVQGLIESDGGVSRGAEIFFTTSSEALAEGVRYQLLRLGVPCGGQCRERDRSQKRQRRAVGAEEGHASRTFDLRIPAVAEIAERIGCKALTKHNWISWGGAIFSRVRAAQPIAPVPFVCDLKVEGTPSYMTESALAHNGGKRKGAVCCYLETWHLDIEEFLELRKNTGDDRRRTHDMNTANWIPDLFMKRVMENGEWTLFSPSSVADLHDKVGRDFEEAYLRYEDKAARGEIKPYKKISAQGLWRKMLSMLFETGHPWITFKDPCNIRSPQQHVGVVHSSNLCTEITLNTNDSEIAVCNLGSVNLVAHMKRLDDGSVAIDHDKLKRTVRTAMRMLDNVIDINYYAVKKARDSNLRHRPVGLGIMGFQDCLHLQRLPYASDAAVEFADRSMEAVCYYAYWASSELAEERGRYSSYRGSLWDRGILPQDTLKLLSEQRGGYVEIDESATMDWAALRSRISEFGMRNSNCVAIAPTATISNIIGVSACIEPTFENLYAKSNLSGEFTIVNDYLVRDLKRLGLWDEVMVADLKFFDGSLAKIDRVPEGLREIYATAFEVEPRWLVEAAARRQKWIDQAQSLNIYMAGVSGKRLDETYRLAWLRGLKTTYYLRTLSASSAEKSTGRGGELNSVPVNGGLGGGLGGGSKARPVTAAPEPEVVGQACMLKPGDAGFEECEACQ